MTIRTDLKYLGNNEFEVMEYVDDKPNVERRVKEGGLFEIGSKVKMTESFDQMNKRSLAGKKATIGDKKVEIHGASYSCVKHKDPKYNVSGDCHISVSPNSSAGGKRYRKKTRKSKKTRKARKTRRT